MDRLRQHPWSHATHPKTSIYTHPHAEAHAHGCTPLLRHPCPPHSPVHSGPLHHLLHSKKVLQLALHKLSPPHKPTHVHIRRLSHTRMHTRLPTAIFGEERRPQALTCMRATSACLHTRVYSHTRQPLPMFWFSRSRHLRAQSHRLGECVYLCQALPAPSFSCQQVCAPTQVDLPMDRGFCPLSPPPSLLLLRSCASPPRNPLVACIPLPQQ